jgi:two-component system, NtrC family, sensor kinase
MPVARVSGSRAELDKELAEAREQQRATGEVLRIISSSPGELEAVFQAMLANATRLCGAKFSVLFLYEGDAFRAVALHGAAPPSFVENRRRNPMFRPSPGTGLARVAATKQTVQIADVQAEPAYQRSSLTQAIGIETGGIRTQLLVPMLKEGALIGTFNLFRQEVRPFTDKQIELVKNFAAQAVIAIENTRLLNELRQRTTDLSEALEQQRATAEILEVISSLPADVQPVFDTIVRNFLQLCGGVFGCIFTFDGELVHLAGAHGFTPEQLADVKAKYPVRVDDPSVLSARAILARAPVHVEDIMSDAQYDRQHVATAGIRRLLAVPMLREGVPLGAIVSGWAEAGAPPKQHEDLLKVFAAQAVIAIENVRLLNELRERTSDLSEALEQQTATSEVLRVISSSPGELEPVFETMLANAVRICGAKFGVTSVREGDAFRVIATHGAPPAFVEQRRREPIIRPTPGHNLERLLRTKEVVHVPDILADPASAPTLAKFGGAKALVNVPLLKDGDLIGSIVIFRQEAGPFSGKQIELVKKLRRPGCDRDREYPPAQRAARVVAAADLYRRRSQGHQPLGL